MGGRVLDGQATRSHLGLKRPFWLGGRTAEGKSGSRENSEEAV